MNADSFSRLPLVLVFLVVATIAGAVGFAVLAAGRLPDGPVDLVWDKTACATCSMHVGEPPFAAQLTTKDGHTHAFDDPGCLFVFLQQQAPPLHTIFFRHHQQARWLPASAVAFVRVEPTPMGFGLAAVDPGTPSAIDFAAAKAHCLAHEERGGR
jgi:hypothetical protein